MFDTATLTTDRWTEDPDGIFDNAGDVGGDIQDSESYNRRFAIKLEDGTYAVLDFYAYWAKEDPETMVNARTDRWIQTMVQYAVCADPNDVGETEKHSDIRYWDQGPDDELFTPRTRIVGLTREDLSEATNQMGT